VEMLARAFDLGVNLVDTYENCGQVEPFARLIRLVFRSASAEKSQQAAEQFARRVPAHEGVEVLGPVECPLAVISGNARTQVLLRSQDFRKVHAATRQALNSFAAPAGVYTEVDVDPVSLL